MSDLYTSAVHLKRLLEGQATPAFTPAPEAVLKVLDPQYFPGMGALNEDNAGRLRCPVRGCGEWHMDLFRHMKKHNGIGGAAMIKRALSIPKATPLMSAVARSRHREALGANEITRRREQARRIARRVGTRAPSPMPHSVSQRNALDRCPAQLAHKIDALARKLGRSPSYNEFGAEYGRPLRDAVVRVYGTWNNAKAHCGLSALPTGGKPGQGAMPLALVIESLKTWHRAHGRLPSASEAQSPNRAPAIPSHPTILKAFGVSTWAAAMRSVEAHLRKAS